MYSLHAQTQQGELFSSAYAKPVTGNVLLWLDFNHPSGVYTGADSILIARDLYSGNPSGIPDYDGVIANDYELLNGTEWVQTGFPKYAQFDGVNDFMGNGDDAYNSTIPVTIDMRRAFSINCWARYSGNIGSVRIDLCGQSANQGPTGQGMSFHITTSGGGVDRHIAIAGEESKYSMATGYNIHPDKWHFLSFVREGYNDSGKIRGYVNGREYPFDSGNTLPQSVPYDNRFPTNHSDFLEIGRFKNSTDYEYRGTGKQIAFLSIHSGALGTSEINQMYRLTRPYFYD